MLPDQNEMVHVLAYPEKLARDKHSRLFILRINDTEKSFITQTKIVDDLNLLLSH
jgi:hypothetical protein